jgi:hypothetical protein
MTFEVALVADRACAFAIVLSKPVPRPGERGRIIVTTLATFAHEDKALAFLREVRWVEEAQTCTRGLRGENMEPALGLEPRTC